MSWQESTLVLARLNSQESFSVSDSIVLKGSTQTVTGKQLKSLLKVGDWIALSPDNRELQLLAPALRPPRTSQVQEGLLRQWNQFLVNIRDFFRSRGFVEVATPTLVVCPGTEPYLDPVPAGAGHFLPTSPELHLKKALAMGMGPLFEIRPCFRAGEISERHQPEFLMLEWYRPMTDLSSIRQDLVDLVQFLSAKPVSKFQTETLAGLFKKELGFDLTPGTSREELLGLAKKLNLHFTPEESWDDLFNLIFVDRLEKDLGEETPLFLENYPPGMAALARLTPEGWGDRFEFYWKGFEIANAFHELNDPEEQFVRAQEDLEKKRKLGKIAVPVDSDFMDALFEGIPPSAGIALGLERLFMCLTGIRNFSSFRVFTES